MLSTLGHCRSTHRQFFLALTALLAAASHSHAADAVRAASSSDYLFAAQFEELKPVALAAGYTSTCAVMSDSTAECWGQNAYGQLGNPNDGYTYSAHAVPVIGSNGLQLSGVLKIAIGDFHACAILNDGSVQCWGSNTSGQLGLGFEDPDGVIHIPAEVPGLIGSGETAVEIAAGMEHTCVLLSSSVVKCWGENGVEQAGQLNPDAPYPTSVASPSIVDLSNQIPTHLIAGQYHTCVTTPASLYPAMCWGVNNFGELGRISDVLKYWDLPGPSVPQMASATSLISGPTANHNCATIPSGMHECWGRFNIGQLGDGTYANGDPWGRETPSDIANDPGFEMLAAGALNSCGIFQGAIWCWGDNSAGQLTDDSLTFSAEPFETSVVSGATDVALSASFVCAIISDTVECWGENSDGQLGRDAICGDPIPDACGSSIPEEVHGL
jgi:alpha-tubulin suppressor-like RCC1 family protein